MWVQKLIVPSARPISGPGIAGIKFDLGSGFTGIGFIYIVVKIRRTLVYETVMLFFSDPHIHNTVILPSTQKHNITVFSVDLKRAHGKGWNILCFKHLRRKCTKFFFKKKPCLFVIRRYSRGLHQKRI